MLYLLIIIAEVAFWVLVLGGLLARYALRAPTLSAVLLYSVPLLDLALLTLVGLDIRGGGEVESAHGLAVVYLGVTIAFGHRMIEWADQRVAHRFAGGPPPRKPPQSGMAKARYEASMWVRHALAYGVAWCATALLAWLAGDHGWDRIGTVLDIMRVWLIVLGVDALFAFSYFLFPRREKNAR